mmetsp:Transcript_30961/g.43962  ORF Transcript_30961/g.43962 Transcript_30961/m.43962 type:complete len:233 (-) Transcript_30961:470-1168(-)
MLKKPSSKNPSHHHLLRNRTQLLGLKTPTSAIHLSFVKDEKLSSIGMMERTLLVWIMTEVVKRKLVWLGVNTTVTGVRKDPIWLHSFQARVSFSGVERSMKKSVASQPLALNSLYFHRKRIIFSQTIIVPRIQAPSKFSIFKLASCLDRSQCIPPISRTLRFHRHPSSGRTTTSTSRVRALISFQSTKHQQWDCWIDAPSWLTVSMNSSGRQKLMCWHIGLLSIKIPQLMLI